MQIENALGEIQNCVRNNKEIWVNLREFEESQWECTSNRVTNISDNNWVETKIINEEEDSKTGNDKDIRSRLSKTDNRWETQLWGSFTSGEPWYRVRYPWAQQWEHTAWLAFLRRRPRTSRSSTWCHPCRGSLLVASWATYTMGQQCRLDWGKEIGKS